MTGLHLRIGGIVVALAAAVALSPPAQAHGGDEGLVVEPATTSPGGAVSVRGDLPTTSDILLVLSAPAGESMSLARIGDPHQGHFEAVVTVPLTVTPGAWHVQALAAGTVLAESELTVTGGPPAGGAPDDRAEPVAVPSGSASRALSAIRPGVAAVAAKQGPASTGVPWWPHVVLAVALVGAGAGLALRHTTRSERAARARTPRT